MISIKQVKHYCKEYWKIENYEIAVKSAEPWVCHHRLEITPFSGNFVSSDYLKSQKMYYNIQSEALIFMSRIEHKRLHSRNPHVRAKIGIASKRNGYRSPELRARISATLKGHPVSQETILKAKQTKALRGDIASIKAKEAANKYKLYKENGGILLWNEWRKQNAQQ